MVFAKVKQKNNRVIVKFSGFPQDDKECKGYLQLLDEIYQQKMPFIILYDARNIGWLSWKHIHIQANFMKSKEIQTKKYMIRAAVVVNSIAARSILKTLFSIRKPAAPCQVFTSIEKGKEFLRSSNLDIVFTGNEPTNEKLSESEESEHDLEQVKLAYDAALQLNHDEQQTETKEEKYSVIRTKLVMNKDKSDEDISFQQTPEETNRKFNNDEYIDDISDEQEKTKEADIQLEHKHMQDISTEQITEKINQLGLQVDIQKYTYDITDKTDQKNSDITSATIQDTPNQVYQGNQESLQTKSSTNIKFKKDECIDDISGEQEKKKEADIQLEHKHMEDISTEQITEKINQLGLQVDIQKYNYDITDKADQKNSDVPSATIQDTLIYYQGNQESLFQQTESATDRKFKKDEYTDAISIEQTNEAHTTLNTQECDAKMKEKIAISNLTEDISS
jgi:predicted component of type VI protein secretion system